jgi:hypothetical protein
MHVLVLEYTVLSTTPLALALSLSITMVTAKPSWLDDLETKGYAVVPGVIPQEACDEFVKEAWDWLESFPYGFKRDDRSTWTSEHLPHGPTGGLYNRYSVNHEAFVWKIRM